MYDFQIEDALQGVQGVSTNYNLRVSKDGDTDVLHYKVEVFEDGDVTSNALQAKVTSALENLSITHKQGVREGRFVVQVELVAHASLVKTDRGKLKDQFIDARKEV